MLQPAEGTTVPTWRASTSTREPSRTGTATRAGSTSTSWRAGDAWACRTPSTSSRPGDFVVAPADERHYHGAARGAGAVWLAITWGTTAWEDAPERRMTGAFDAVVAGAGFAGLRAARDLADAGRSVLVLEARRAARRAHLDAPVRGHGPAGRDRRLVVHARARRGAVRARALRARDPHLRSPVRGALAHRRRAARRPAGAIRRARCSRRRARRDRRRRRCAAGAGRSASAARCPAPSTCASSARRRRRASSSRPGGS